MANRGPHIWIIRLLCINWPLRQVRSQSVPHSTIILCSVRWTQRTCPSLASRTQSPFFNVLYSAISGVVHAGDPITSVAVKVQNTFDVPGVEVQAELLAMKPFLARARPQFASDCVKLWVNGWQTSRRMHFATGVEKCIFCGAQSSDDVIHYVRCSSLRALLDSALGQVYVGTIFDFLGTPDAILRARAAAQCFQIAHFRLAKRGMTRAECDDHILRAAAAAITAQGREAV